MSEEECHAFVVRPSRQALLAGLLESAAWAWWGRHCLQERAAWVLGRRSQAALRLLPASWLWTSVGGSGRDVECNIPPLPCLWAGQERGSCHGARWLLRRLHPHCHNQQGKLGNTVRGRPPC